MESLKNIPNIQISLSPACFLLHSVRKGKNKELGLSSQAFFMQILRKYLIESGFFRFPLHFLLLQKRNDILPGLTLVASIFPSLSLLFKNYFSFAPLLHTREKVKKEIKSYAKDILLKTGWMTRTHREPKPEGLSQSKGQERLGQEKIRHEVFSYDKYPSGIGRGVEKKSKGKSIALKIPYINQMPLLSRNPINNLSMHFFSKNIRKNSAADEHPGENINPEKPESSKEGPFRNKGDSFSQYLTYDSHKAGETILQRYFSLISFIKGRSSISRNIYDITSLSHFSPNAHISSQDTFISGWSAQREMHTMQREESARSETVSRSNHFTHSSKYNLGKVREEHMTSQDSSIERKSFLSKSKNEILTLPSESLKVHTKSPYKVDTDFPPMVYVFPDKADDSAGVKKETRENFEVKSSLADSYLSLDPQRFSPGSIPESDIVNLSDKVYSLIVERVKRERKMRGY